MPALRFTPVYHSRVWGGRLLASHFGRTLPLGNIGESWELVDRPEAQSVIVEGPYAGLTLRQLCERHGTEILKADWQPADKFPLIVKWLDCRERLSLQVHPPEKIARELNAQPKTECWSIVQAEKDAHIFAGFQRATNMTEFSDALAKNTAENLVRKIPTQAGDFIFIPSGRLHAIGGGNLILEIQQNSDTTYRVYDWGRPRELHLTEALRSIDFADTDAKISGAKNEKEETLVTHPLFSLKRIRLDPGSPLTLPGMPTAQILTVTEGQVACDGAACQAGENLLLPRDETHKISASKNSTLILTYNFL